MKQVNKMTDDPQQAQSKTGGAAGAAQRGDQPKASGKASGGLSAAAASLMAAGGAALNEAEATALKQKITDLQQRYNEMPGRVRLTGLVQDLTALSARIKSFPEGITAIRQRGYPYREYLENKVKVFGQQWDEIDGEIKQWMKRESAGLENDLNEAEPLIRRLNEAQMNTGQQKLAEQVESHLEGLDARVKAAEERIRSLYDGLQREVGQTNSQLEEIKRYLEWKEQASFPFLAGETVYRAAQAEWVNGGDNPDGYVFLTNQRMVFEQQEKTGKKLGLFGGKQVHQLLWEAPLNLVEKAEAENKGLLGGKDMVHLSLGSGAPYDRITLEVKGGVNCKLWAAEIGRMVRGEIGAATIQDPELAERLRNAPTDCPTCSAVLPRVVAGQNTITCKYCGVSVRI